METTMYELITYSADETETKTHYIDFVNDITDIVREGIFNSIALRDWDGNFGWTFKKVDPDWVEDMGFDVE